MSIFNSILQKLGIQKPAAAPVKSAAVSVAQDSKPKPAPAAESVRGASIGVSSSAAPASAVSVSAGASAQVSAPAPVEEPKPESFSMAPDPSPVEIETPVMPMVDVLSMLEELAKSHPGADWKVSIADLLMMLGFEHSYAYRKELAAELGCPEELMSDSARMNVWLHKTVLQKISENGGNIPVSLLS